MMLFRRIVLATVLVAVAEPAAALAQTVDDGSLPGVDLDVQPTSQRISASWSGFPANVIQYSWSIGTTPGAGDVQPMTPVVPSTGTSAVNLTFFPVEGATYYVTVEGADGVACPTVVTSDGVKIVVLNDGPFSFDLDFRDSSNPIEANWSGFDSQAATFEWAIGTTPGAQDIQPFVNVGAVTSASNATFVPVEGAQYFVTVNALDSVGAFLESATTDGITVPSPPGATPVSGAAPLTVSFTQQLPGVVLYQWDFDRPGGGGGAKPDVISSVSGDAEFTYTVPGQYDAELTMIHAGEGSWSQMVTIDVLPPVNPPTVGLNADVTSGPAPLTVTLTASPSTFDGTVSAYLWDFDGDGVADASSDDTPVITHTYTGVGSFTAGVTVVDGRGNAAAQTTFISVAPPLAGDLPNVISFTATPPTSILGEIVKFDAVADAGGTGVITSYTWDFDGDGDVDRVTAGPTTTWQYEFPGAFVARVTVTDSENLSAGLLAFPQVDLAPLTPRCWMVQPLNGLSVWGDFVSLGAVCIPPDQVTAVDFYYREALGSPFPPPTDPSWIPIDTATPPPVELYGVHWDVTGLNAGASYELIAVATFVGGAVVSSAGIEGITVTVDPTNPDEEEFSGSPFTKLLTTSFTPGSTVTKGITRDVTFKLIAGTSPSLEQMRIERRSENPHPVEARLQGLRFLPNHFRNFKLGSGGKLMKPTRVTMYCDFGSSTVLPDGTDLTKATFRMYCFNDGQLRWEPLLNQSSNANKLLLKAKAVSTGDIGIVVESARAVESSSSSGCALLGPELLAPLLLLRLRRRRRRA